jgi:hypothetical protein
MSEQTTSDRQAPRTPNESASSESGRPFRALRRELGLSRVETPALRPRHNSNPFQLRIGPDAVRSEAALQTAINEVVYNEDCVQDFMRLSVTPAEAISVRGQRAARVLSQFTDESLTLRDALWYLEYTGWDVELAILQQLQDSIDRAEAPNANSVRLDQMRQDSEN